MINSWLPEEILSQSEGLKGSSEVTHSLCRGGLLPPMESVIAWVQDIALHVLNAR